MKTRAKLLSAIHFHMRSNGDAHARDNTSCDNAEGYQTIITGHPARYEIIGESLRGMENMTDVVGFLQRKRVKDEAYEAVYTEQQDQHRKSSLRTSVSWNSEALAETYSSKTKEALVYARRIAQEDALVSAEIMIEDLPMSYSTLSTPSTVSPTSCANKTVMNKQSLRSCQKRVAIVSRSSSELSMM